MAELDITRVDKIYHSRKGDVHAVKALDLIVKPGEIVALLGSSGCGKTSTLRMIAGFEEVSNGSITLGGKPIHTLPPAARGVAMAFEAYREDNVAGSKAVGEPPFMLALSVFEALRDAVAAARPGQPVTLDAPATAERVLRAVGGLAG